MAEKGKKRKKRKEWGKERERKIYWTVYDAQIISEIDSVFLVI